MENVVADDGPCCYQGNTEGGAYSRDTGGKYMKFFAWISGIHQMGRRLSQSALVYIGSTEMGP